MKNLILLLGVLCVCVGLFAIIFVLFYKDQLKKYKVSSQITVKRKKASVQGSKAYEVVSKIPLIGNYIRGIKTKLYMSKNLDENTLRARAVMISLGAFLCCVLAFLSLNRLYGTNLYMQLTILISCLYVNNLIVNRFVKSADVQILKDLPEFINDLKHHYHATSMVDEAIYTAGLKAKQDVSIHAKRIYGIITASNGEILLEDYYTQCPNKFLKILAGFSYLIKEYGDKSVNGVSLYIKNLNYITEEINLEVIKTIQLSYWLKGLPIIALVPLIFPPFIESWLSSSFPAAKDFFASSMAFFLKNVIIFTSVLCYFLILQIQKNENKINRFKTSDKLLDYKLLEIYWVRNIVNLIKPKTKSLQYKTIAHLLQDAGSPLNIACVVLRKVIVGIASFIILIAIFLTAHKVNVDAIMNNAVYGIESSNFSQMLGKLTPEVQKEQSETNRFDKEMMNIVAKAKGKMKRADFEIYIETEIQNRGYVREDIKLTTQRIVKKLEALAPEHIKWWEIVLSLVLALLLCNIPIWMLLFQKTLRNADMQDEVFQFHTIIILLMHHNNVDVQTILEWMRQFSDVFRNAINRCLNNFQNPYRAMEQLKEDVKFKEFVNIIENLQMATDQINIISAFDSLELERDFYKENRKEQNRQVVEKKIALGKLIGFIPFYAVIFLYLVIPLILTSYISMNSIMERMDKL